MRHCGWEDGFVDVWMSRRKMRSDEGDIMENGNPITPYAKKNAMKEIMQEIVLYGRSKSAIMKNIFIFLPTE